MSDQAALDRLRAGSAREIILPDEPDDDAARTIFNAMICKLPAVISQSATVADVATAIRVVHVNHSITPG